MCADLMLRLQCTTCHLPARRSPAFGDANACPPVYCLLPDAGTRPLPPLLPAAASAWCPVRLHGCAAAAWQRLGVAVSLGRPATLLHPVQLPVLPGPCVQA